MRLDEVAPEELSASGPKGGKKRMSPRTSSIATASTRKRSGSSAVTPAAASGSIGRPAGNGRASRRSKLTSDSGKEPVRTTQRKTEPAPKAGRAPTSPVVKQAAASTKVAVLPPKGLSTIETPTRSKAQKIRGVKEGTAMKKVAAPGAVLQVGKLAANAGSGIVPIAAQTKSSDEPRERKTRWPRGQMPNLAAQADAEETPALQRSSVASSIAIAATTRNIELLSPIERYVGLDIGKRTEFCEVRQGRVTTRATVSSEEQLEELLEPSTGRARVVLEACREAWYLYDLLTGWGHEVWVVDTTRVRQLGIGQHKRKNDRIDAEVLARASESGHVPRAHVLSHASQRLRMELGVRRALVETRAHYVTSIRSMLRSEGLTVASCTTADFLRKLRATSLPAAVDEVIKPLVVALEVVSPQIEKCDRQLEQHCSGIPVMELLSSRPGVGKVVAAAYISVIDNPGRFRKAHQVEAYLGLVPSESTSGKRKVGAITKQGNAYLRGVLVQAAWSVLRGRRSDPLKSWGQAIAKKRGKKVAAVAVARRLAGILWAMWRDNTRYDPALLGQASARGKRKEAQQTSQTAGAIEVAADSARQG
jgi:transposase